MPADLLSIIDPGLVLQLNPLADPSAGEYGIVIAIVVAVLAALGGGAFGAAIGALPAFIFTGFLVIAGAVATTIGIDGAAATMYAAAWGPLFGPHVGFQGGVAAHAYAAKYKPELQEQEGWGYHDAKNILISLGSNPKVLLVGAVFGAVAQLLKMLTDIVTGTSGSLGFAHIAWVIVFMAFVHRLVFGYSLIGDREAVAERLGSTLDGTSWLSFEYDEAEPHLGHQFYVGEGALLGALVGIIAAYVSIMTGSPWLPFGISAATLIFLETDDGIRPGTGRAGTVVTHQITLAAGVAGLAAFNMGANAPFNPVLYGLLWGVIMGVAGELFRLLGDRLFYAWGETHLDPPAFSIVFTVIIMVVLSNLGIIGTNAFMGIGLHWF